MTKIQSSKSKHSCSILRQINKFHSEKNCTDVASLIGNFGCRNSTVWKFTNFPTTLILCEINFGSFQRVKKCRFNNWILIYRKILLLKMPEVIKNSNFRAAQMVKMVVIGASKWQKLISRTWQKNPRISTLYIPN